MEAAWLRDNWALLGAAGLIAAILCAALLARVAAGGRAQLRRARTTLGKKRKLLRRAGASAAQAKDRLAQLQRRADRVKPRHLDEAREAVADAAALAGIAYDQVLVAENHLRRIILQEFPPAKQARLRARYRVSGTPDKKPFTF